MNLIFVIHNHQPVGNFSYVLEEAYKHAYKPFINEILDVDEFRFAIHFSGYLLQYIEKNHPDLIEKLRYLVGLNRCEIITGGLYEPILILLTKNDRDEQIKRMNDYLEKLFKVRPRGFWLAERVWEQQIASILNENGIKYTFVDDTHFIREGIKKENLDGYFITENEGKSINLFPISKDLRYLIPFKNTHIVFEYLKTLHQKNPDSMALLGDDGEKFGVWPGTYKYVYEEGWLKKFLEGLKQNKEWLHMALPMEFVKKTPPKQRVYLRESSYEEMLEWSNGNFRNFLIKYPESNEMNKRTIYLSNKVKENGLQQTPDALLKSEANDAYWHGVFGGLYLPHLRISVYQNLIKAEKEINKDIFSIQEIDINKDGEKEIVAETPLLNAYFSKVGGSMYELDDKEKEINLLNVLTRREEPYHKKIRELSKNQKNNNVQSVKTIHEIVTLKENDLENFLIYDWYKRNSFIDHFFREDTTIDKVYSMQFGEQGDFVIEKFKSNTDIKNETLYATFSRNGHVWHGENWEELNLIKTFIIKKDSKDIKVHYKINAETEVFLFHGIEINMMLFGDGLKINSKDYKDFMEIKDTEFTIDDFIQEKEIKFKFSEETTLWAFPIYTVSQSESGFEKTPQGITFIFNNKWSIIKNKELFIECTL